METGGATKCIRRDEDFERRETCTALVRAIGTALIRIHEAPPETLAERVGPAFFPDLPEGALARIVAQAYEIYVPRLGKKPGPMLDDYAARIAAGEAFVVEVSDQGNLKVLGKVLIAP